MPLQSFTAKAAAPVTVQAVQYIAPDGADVAGNLDELKALADVREQTPWNPAGGQNYVAAVSADTAYQLEPGGWLLLDADGNVTGTLSDEAFQAAYDAPKSASVPAAPVTDPAAPKA